MKIAPSREEFLRLARRGNVIPVSVELPADLETPVSAFLKLDDGRYSFLLESVEGQEKVARYSFLGTSPRVLITGTGSRLDIATLKQGRPVKTRVIDPCADPLAAIEAIMRRFRFVPSLSLPRFCGGLVGYLGYDLVHTIEPRVPPHQLDDLKAPWLMLVLADAMVIVDHARHRLQLVVNAFTEGRAPATAYREAVHRLEAMRRQLQRPLAPARPRVKARRSAAVTSSVTRAEFLTMVERAKQYIAAGDAIQVVLSQRLERDFTGAPFDIYRALRSLNPSPYMFFLRFGRLCLAGSSPEMLVRCERGHLETRPIAGTRPRGKSEAEDARLAQQLKHSVKERAEHLMLVDLGRNDLGRIAVAGSVRTPELMAIERYSHVLHLVSSVTATARPGTSAADVLRATFPAGTVSGAPKVRAMEIIAELERHARGPYAGAVGYLDFSGNLDTGITIRTVLIQGTRASVQAGAGIVADSRPDREYQETLNKARGMLLAIEQAERGLR